MSAVVTASGPVTVCAFPWCPAGSVIAATATAATSRVSTQAIGAPRWAG
jgi:hypothetical protein